MFDRVIANRQTHAEQCIAAIGLAAYVGQIHRIQGRQQESCWHEYSVGIGRSDIKPGGPISNTSYKLLQFELSSPRLVYFLSVCVFLSFVCLYFYIRHQQGCHDLIIVPLLALRSALFTCIKTAAGSLRVAYVLSNLLLSATAPQSGWLYSSRVYRTYGYNDDRFLLSGINVTSNVSM